MVEVVVVVVVVVMDECYEVMGPHAIEKQARTLHDELSM
jgi:hypothetical protein